MQQDRSSGYVVRPLIDVELAISAGEENGNGFRDIHEEIVEDAIEQAVGASKRRAGAGGWWSSFAGVAGRAERVRFTRPGFRTELAVAGVTVTGVLPGTARMPVGSVAISGNVHRLSCDQALELVDALLLVVTRMDIVAEERYGASADATRDRED